MASGVRYVALLRGINVGGKNLVKMSDLREAFEELGYADVSTYIASGNVLFRTLRQRREELAATVESALRRRFETNLKVVVVTDAELREVVESAPRGFGADTHRCDVIFVRKPLTPKRLFGLLERKDGVDQAWAGRKVVYFSRLDAKASSSRFGKIAAVPEYKDMTIRSWSTTKKLLELAESSAP